MNTTSPQYIAAQRQLVINEKNYQTSCGFDAAQKVVACLMDNGILIEQVSIAGNYVCMRVAQSAQHLEGVQIISTKTHGTSKTVHATLRGVVISWNQEVYHDVA